MIPEDKFEAIGFKYEEKRANNCYSKDILDDHFNVLAYTDRDVVKLIKTFKKHGKPDVMTDAEACREIADAVNSRIIGRKGLEKKVEFANKLQKGKID